MTDYIKCVLIKHLCTFERFSQDRREEVLLHKGEVGGKATVVDADEDRVEAKVVAATIEAFEANQYHNTDDCPDDQRFN